MGTPPFLRLSRVCAVLLALGSLFFSSFLHAETFKLGLHYDPAKDGHGFDLHKVGNTYVLFLYTYDDNGNPEWYLGVGNWNDGVITGSLDRFTYIASNDPPQTADPEIAGSFILDHRFAAVQGACNDGVNRGNATQQAAFAFKIRDETYIWCTQFLFGGQANTIPYYGGAWHTPDDPGYGFSMSQQDDTGIAIVYYYDSNNDPRWALAIGSPEGEMTLENYTGYCRSCPLVERIIEPVGSLTLNWDPSTTPGSGTDAADLLLSYPTAPFGDWNRQLIPALISDGEPTAQVSIGQMPGQDFFNMFISSQLIESRCIACHVTAGLAAGTRLVYTANDRTGNFSQLAAVANTEGGDYILNKARGVSHGGAVQVPSDSNEYLDLQLLFGVLDGTVSDPTSGPVSLFDKVGMLSYEKTLRRAAIIIAGRLPKNSEIRVARTGTEAEFRATLRNLLRGDGFHQFLIEGANDRLLTDKWVYRDFMNPSFVPYYPEYKRLVIDNIDTVRSLEELEKYDEAWLAWQLVQGQLQMASAREPLELIAYIVEKDRPYTNVVTARFTMVNPLLAEAYGSDANFVDSNDHTEYRLGHNQAQLLVDDTYLEESVLNTYNRYISGGIPHATAHSGVLNTPALLARYPSTATNRNRARARWTYYFFLGVDIEKSAARTTDPVALADTNNPTLNNPACTVCHQLHDPVAGTYQNHGDVGFYRDQWGGMDSLSDDYKYSDSSAYQEGDTWYRDMRTPGFNGKTAPNADNSLQWLGNEIAADPRFASASVKFWWPALFGRQPLVAPEESADGDFEAKLTAFETQNSYIESLGQQFGDGFTQMGPFNLKDLLVEIIMGPWFRASGATGVLDSDQEKALESGFVGAEKLLTPKQLERKTKAVTGHIWERWDGVLSDYTALRDRYNLSYGGIDSDGIKTRPADLTSVMSSVVDTMAAESACSIAVLDFDTEDSQRKLFKGISKWVTPVYEGGQQSIRTASPMPPNSVPRFICSLATNTSRLIS